MGVERYALAVINFAAPIDKSLLNPAYYNETLNEMLISDTLWVNEGWQCTWPNVVCIDGSVVDLFISSAELGDQLSGTITTEIGLLKNLSIFDMSSNALTGSIPSEIGEMTSIEYFQVENNILNGTIPSQLGQMTDMVYLTLYSNKLTGTIPSTLGQLNLLVDLDLSNNSLTGSVPAEIVDKIPSYNDFNVYGNQLSNLTPIDGQVICTTTTDTTNNSSLTGEHYCNCQSHCLKELNEGYGKLCQCEKPRIVANRTLLIIISLIVSYVRKDSKILTSL